MKRRSLLFGMGGAAMVAGAGVLGWRWSTGSMAEYVAYAGELRRALDPSDLRDLVRYAALAANSHNTQPWRFNIGNGYIDLLPDRTRRTPVVDPDDHHLHVSLGCAAENLAIAAAATGRPGEMIAAPEGGGLRYAYTGGATRPDPLLAAIPRRQSTRAEYDGQPIDTAVLAALEAAGREPGVALVLITDRHRIGRARDLVVAGNTAQMGDPDYMRELVRWVRFNPRSAMATGDGLFAAASGNPSLPTLLGRLAFDRLLDPAAENDKYARQMASVAGLAVFIAETPDPPHWQAVGRACQRFALTATSLGLKASFMNQPVEVAALRADLATLVGGGGRRPDLMMRFGNGPDLPFSPRRPITEILA